MKTLIDYIKESEVTKYDKYDIITYYPKEDENVLCYCKCRTEIKFCCVGHTIIGGDNKIRWRSSDRSEKLNVYAWREITPSKEVKENEN